MGNSSTSYVQNGQPFLARRAAFSHRLSRGQFRFISSRRESTICKCIAKHNNNNNNKGYLPVLNGSVLLLLLLFLAFVS